MLFYVSPLKCDGKWNTPLLNPILTGLFESKFLLGGGSDLSPKGADCREILHGCQDTCKEYCYNLFLAENCLFIMLLWFMQIRCIIITYLLIFTTNKISEGQFLAESFVEALLTCWHGQIRKFQIYSFVFYCFVNFLCILLFLFLMYFIVFYDFLFFVIWSWLISRYKKLCKWPKRQNKHCFSAF